MDARGRRTSDWRSRPRRWPSPRRSTTRWPGSGRCSTGRSWPPRRPTAPSSTNAGAGSRPRPGRPVSPCCSGRRPTRGAGWRRWSATSRSAERLTNEALELGGATGQPDAMSIYGGQLVDLRWHQGRDAELVELIERMVAATPEIDSFQAALARIYVDVGRVEDARALLTAGSRARRLRPPVRPVGHHHHRRCGRRRPSRRRTRRRRGSWSTASPPSPTRWSAAG